MQKLKVSLIITTYNWPKALFLVLKSVKNQFILPDEIIVADDGSSKETANVIKEFSNKFKLKIIHSWQEDKGFRAAMSRITDILMNVKGTTAYSQLRSKLALENQDIQNLKIQKIIKNGINYDCYIVVTMIVTMLVVCLLQCFIQCLLYNCNKRLLQ